MPASDVKKRSDSETALRAMIILMAAGLVGVFIYALQAWKTGAFLSTAGVGLLVAGASLLVGGLLGFLFGIPRTQQQKNEVPPAGQPPTAQAGMPPPDHFERPEYRANTNLEDISDWLTKILVGVGLTQLASLPAQLNALSAFIAQGLGDTPGSQTFAMAILIYFVVCGFLFSYLWTRLYLPVAFRRTDLEMRLDQAEHQAAEAKKTVDAMSSTVQEVASVKKEIDERGRADPKAMDLVNRQLNPSSDSIPISQDDLNSAVSDASPIARATIFNQAANLRSQTWREDKTKMERTIPVFRALIAADSDEKFHQYHGQLGFALKDRMSPDWNGAKTELDTAIELRDLHEGHGSGWFFYEFNRSICNIMLDPDFKQERPSSLQLQQAVLKDLQVVFQVGVLKEKLVADPVIKQWYELNNLDPNSLPVSG